MSKAIKITAWVVGIVTVLSIFAGGAYKLGSDTKSDANDALKTENIGLIRKIKDIKLSNSLQIPLQLPESTTNAVVDPEKIKELSEKLAKAEMERDQIAKQISQAAINALDPRSELHILLRDLKSEDDSIRSDAVAGLLRLKAPESFTPLLEHFKSRSKDNWFSLDGYFYSRWYELLFQLNPKTTVELMVSELECQKPEELDHTNNTFLRIIETVESIDYATPPLEKLALTSRFSLTRTYAKVMLRELTEKRAELIEKEKKHTKHLSVLEAIKSGPRKIAVRRKGSLDERTKQEILLDIEDYIKSLNLSRTEGPRTVPKSLPEIAEEIGKRMVDEAKLSTLE